MEKMKEDSGFIGIFGLERGDLQNLKDKGEQMSVSGTGVLVIPSKLDDLVMKTVKEIHVRGWGWCSFRIRENYSRACWVA